MTRIIPSAERQPVPEHVRREAANISRTDGAAYVYLLQSGRYIASSTDAHLIMGKRVERYVYGNKREL